MKIVLENFNKKYCL